jgi:hypothetical protein
MNANFNAETQRRKDAEPKVHVSTVTFAQHQIYNTITRHPAVVSRRRMRAFWQIFTRGEDGKCHVDLHVGLAGLWSNIRDKNSNVTQFSMLNRVDRQRYWREKEEMRAAGMFDCQPEGNL